MCVNDNSRPYDPYIPSSKAMELQDGRLFQAAQSHLQQDPDDLVVGVSLYADKTWVTQNGRFTCEPVIGTLSCFNVEARSRPEFWFILGYVTSVKFSSAELSELSARRVGALIGAQARNYHRQLSVILRSLVDIQWSFPCYDGLCLQPKEKNLILPIISVCGDGQGSDTFACRYKAYGVDQVDRLHWACDCPSVECQEAFHVCSWFTQEQIEPLVMDALKISRCSDADKKKHRTLSSRYPCTLLRMLSFSH